jgi:hypothetical protein
MQKRTREVDNHNGHQEVRDSSRNSREGAVDNTNLSEDTSGVEDQKGRVTKEGERVRDSLSNDQGVQEGEVEVSDDLGDRPAENHQGEENALTTLIATKYNR